MTPQEFLAYLHRQIAIHGSQKALAQHCGVSASFLSDVLRGRREPGKTMLEALGFEKIVTYRRIRKIP